MIQGQLSKWMARYGEQLLNTRLTVPLLKGAYKLHEATIGKLATRAPPITVFRGVPRDHPRFFLASHGLVVPRNPFGLRDIDSHNFGSAKSAFTSWTRTRSIGVTYAEPDGILLEASLPGNRLQWSPDIWMENEVLIEGIVAGAKVTKIVKSNSPPSPSQPPL
jgi:hypothetical protein